jgi:hypothetical protein
VVEIFNFKKGVTIVKLNAAVSNSKYPGNINVPLRER